MPILNNIKIFHAMTPAELPSRVAKAIGCMYLKRYYPDNPALAAQDGFKKGLWRGCMAWAETGEGRVVGWAIRAVPERRTHAEVMVFVPSKWRRNGIANALLDRCREMVPKVHVYYYAHDEESKAFYEFRSLKLSRDV